jgi:hypothetical protein
MCAFDYRYFDKYFLFKDSMVHDYLLFIKNRIIIFDRYGVPLGQGPRIRRGLLNYVYTPVGVVNHGLFLYNDLVENTNRLALALDKRAAFIKQVDWLIRNRTDKNDMSFWYYHYPAVEHGCKPPWRSALTQGLALSLLLRAYHLSRNEELSRLAKRVAISMKTPISEGGFLDTDENGDYWYQEYMGNCGYVLNGFIFAMWGLYDYYLYSNDEKCKTIFDRCVDTLRKNLKQYDWRIGLAKWTIYDLKDKNPVTLGYQKLHVSLLRDLYTITREKFLLDYANLWESYVKQPNILLVSLSRHARAQVLELFKLFKIEPHGMQKNVERRSKG